MRKRKSSEVSIVFSLFFLLKQLFFKYKNPLRLFNFHTTKSFKINLFMLRFIIFFSTLLLDEHWTSSLLKKIKLLSSKNHNKIKWVMYLLFYTSLALLHSWFYWNLIYELHFIRLKKHISDFVIIFLKRKIHL